MSAGYTENDIQESAGKLLHDELGWQVVFAYNKEVLGEKTMRKLCCGGISAKPCGG